MRIKTKEEWMARPFLRPFRARLSSPLLWRFNRRGVARGMALGLFAAFAVPLAQTPFAALFAVGARANLPVAAAATFVTNPLTMPAIYYLAYQAGAFVLQQPAGPLLTFSPDVGVMERALSFLLAFAGPAYLGLLLFAGVAAALGWLLVQGGWRFLVLAKRAGRLRRRKAAIRNSAAEDGHGLHA